MTKCEERPSIDIEILLYRTILSFTYDYRILLIAYKTRFSNWFFANLGINMTEQQIIST